MVSIDTTIEHLQDKEISLIDDLSETYSAFQASDAIYIQRMFFLLHESFLQYYLSPQNNQMTQLQVFLGGIIFRTVDLSQGILQGLVDKNIHVAYSSIRGLIETVAVLNYVKKNKDYLSTAIKGQRDDPDTDLVNVLTQVDHLDRRLDGIQDTYDYLSNFIHPNPASIHSLYAPETDGQTFKASYPEAELSDGEIKTIVEDLIRLLETTYDDLAELYSYGRFVDAYHAGSYGLTIYHTKDGLYTTAVMRYLVS
ncbi:MAG: hypothetical protein MUP66_01220 [Candidatus Nanohaloarchaeota archaeon QJJ-5]|nr:hypothetical protein [Candidatus Nanohaloarchaeota archaeon QJJ-5]